MATSKKFKEILCLLYSAVLFLSGAVLVGYSILLLYKLIYHFKFVPADTIGPFIVIFILGLFHIALTWLAVKGSSREHSFHIIMFMVITAVFILIEVTCGIWSMVLWDEVDVKSMSLMEDSFNGFLKHNYDKREWVRLQSKLQCCGLDGIRSYTSGSITGSIPVACCNNTNPVNNVTCTQMYDVGCKTPLSRYVKNLLLQIALTGFLSGVLQVAGVFAFYKFFKAVKQERAEQAARRLAVINETNPLNRQNSQPP